MTDTYRALATVTLASPASTVTFSSIPTSYRDLVLVANARSTRANTADFLALRVNGDSGTNYTFVLAAASSEGGTSSSFPAAANYMQGLDVHAANNTANVFTHTTFDFIDYSVTDKHKTALVKQNAVGVVGLVTTMFANRWASTAAINSISLSLPYTGPSSFTAGSTFDLYGIAS